MQSTTFRGDEESRLTRNEDHNTYSVLRSRTEEEKQRRKRQWQRQQDREIQHEKLKQRKIEEYERKRAQALKYAEEKSSRHSRSKSGSESPARHRYRGRSTSTASQSSSLREKKRLKMNKSNYIGEGSKPIFDREELKKTTNKTNEVEERRIVVAIDKEQSASPIKLHTSKRRSSSLSPVRNRVYNSGYPSSYQSSHRMDLKHGDKTEKCDGRSSLEERREYKEKYTERDANKHDINRSHSREPRNSHSRSFMEERSYRDRYRERSKKRFYERSDRERERERERNRERDKDSTSDRDRSRERRNIESSIPIHYSSFPPRPIVVGPMVPLRGQIPPMARGRHPPLMASVRPFPPRFPSDMYRLRHPNLMDNIQDYFSAGVFINSINTTHMQNFLH
ncbi:PREDICTED: uncharacterized protein DDB_G0287625-like [Wasmannia auropunctata]|uniref:uncharacterized protein DDB_G0287625-like n=1 Tax=Wasmannia auropunctata TaxID=64793 RepID=UPI0005F03F43|nr:PREDICTED: uncharacterized protein DDB_G0287625-like [Wasmannia auropunctata]